MIVAWDSMTKAQRLYCSDAGAAFNTFYHAVAANAMKSYLSRHAQSRVTTVGLDLAALHVVSREPRADARLCFEDRLQRLGAEARHVAQMFLDGPAEALGLVGGEGVKHVRGRLRAWMRDQRGWGQQTIATVLAELGEVCQ